MDVEIPPATRFSTQLAFMKSASRRMKYTVHCECTCMYSIKFPRQLESILSASCHVARSDARSRYLPSIARLNVTLS